MNLIPVIMSGGVGSRLWPVSRELHPKLFMPLPDGQNLIHKTFVRVSSLEGVLEVMTVTNNELFFKTEDEYLRTGKACSAQSFILEPFGRNTAAAVAAAATQLNDIHGADALMLVLAADHLITDQAAFAESVKKAQVLAAEGWLVTFGVKPQYPETGFGYIQADSNSPLSNGFKVQRFVEKPDLETAKEYMAAGSYYWNSGMFCFRVGTLLEELSAHAPDILDAVRTTLEHSRFSEGEQHRCVRLDGEYFAKVADISIDYALMERSDRVATVPCDIGWSDIGSWSAMSELTPADASGNRLEGEVLVHQANGNFVQSPERLTALVGVKDLIVVVTPDAVLVSHKDSAQEVKQIVAQLKKSGHDAHLTHRTAQRPWGTYTTLEEGERFKIKRIVVKPGASLSLQMHHHRSEHWVVVSGMARVLNDENEMLLDTNESTFIRAGRKHRLENPGVIDLVLIEVQSGSYLGEDDIIRFQDIYGRAGSEKNL
ncbi:mannose-1-phosphate guanylyltransferase/mannose-6-phosphate isomerase [Pseudomonas protegens]|uniref:mannose-1-phosphate guanylyltransferase/mannose-6-phosphate isomerase n=1 Tax=Pseudomonas TaxID=286 RepID=UPI0013733ECF|nr:MULTISPECIES: mannose-1-phosphate guanylyltransferase/mannose-6-phosphate isomerase [Pseudomonas]MBF0642463.1 mannose-1-phosphate guanylyltransferase/mannose-6-phosphate isomerase [Pseudomonas protegens]MCU1766934.1 mannose-1-phosphate guanylyltransferase/mannose-6-phosphate isomerase [Pseudomonas protegens]MDS9876716.1 mannose-1-phosphate guanylyltransferase/mannose-6-phosphate isomerase [Pseudomonas protegens]MDT9642440.1 mannose-1-phosphate guanylyltransferase/mannose-6-phosphate isomeras